MTFDLLQFFKRVFEFREFYGIEIINLLLLLWRVPIMPSWNFACFFSLAPGNFIFKSHLDYGSCQTEQINSFSLTLFNTCFTQFREWSNPPLFLIPPFGYPPLNTKIFDPPLIPFSGKLIPLMKVGSKQLQFIFQITLIICCLERGWALRGTAGVKRKEV